MRIPLKDDPVGQVKIPAIGVVGSGVMGTGLAQVLAHTGHRVVLIDKLEPALEHAKTGITNTFVYRRCRTRSPFTRVQRRF